MSRAFDLMLFDLDGTLIETAPEICDAVNDTLRQFHLPEVSQQQVNDWIGHGTRTLLIQALAFAGDTTVDTVRQSDSLALIAAEFDKHYLRRCGTRSHLYPQVREVLQALRAQGVKLAVVTNKESRYTTTVLDAHQFDAGFRPCGQRRYAGREEAGPGRHPQLPGAVSGGTRPHVVRRRLVHRRGHGAQRRRTGVGAALRLQHGRADRGLRAGPGDRRLHRFAGNADIAVARLNSFNSLFSEYVS
jgi:phosphoglycolate phosphatase-like HAD superfamily hydrolase